MDKIARENILKKIAKTRWIREISKLSPKNQKRLIVNLTGRSRFLKELGRGSEGFTQVQVTPRLGFTVKKRYFPLSKWVGTVPKKEVAYRDLPMELKQHITKRYKTKFGVVPSELNEYVKGRPLKVEQTSLPVIRLGGQGSYTPATYGGPDAKLYERLTKKFEKTNIGDLGPQNILVAGKKPKVIDFVNKSIPASYERLGRGSIKGPIRSFLLNGPAPLVNNILSRWEATGKFPRKLFLESMKKSKASGAEVLEKTPTGLL